MGWPSQLSSLPEHIDRFLSRCGVNLTLVQIEAWSKPSTLQSSLPLYHSPSRKPSKYAALILYMLRSKKKSRKILEMQ